MPFCSGGAHGIARISDRIREQSCIEMMGATAICWCVMGECWQICTSVQMPFGGISCSTSLSELVTSWNMSSVRALPLEDKRAGFVWVAAARRAQGARKRYTWNVDEMEPLAPFKQAWCRAGRSRNKLAALPVPGEQKRAAA